MASRKTRLSIVLDQELSGLVGNLARRRRRSRSALAVDLIWEALEIQEDVSLSELAERRERSAPEKTVPHEKAW